jgi:hypothetical protein
VGLLDRLFGRKGRGPEAPAPTRDDTLSSTSVQGDQGWVAPSDTDVKAPPDSDSKVDEPSQADSGVGGGESADAGAGDGGGGNGGGGGD